jgi:glutamine phosphoribosylpyrophosphate amidotransferase
MCSVIGVFLRNITANDIDIVTKTILESRIRGMHATGVSYFKSGKIHTIRKPVSAKKFLEENSVENFVEGDQLTMIAHCRYSTSDLEFNQPIYNKDLSIVHNGVISQELPENWESIYGIKTKTKNDTELLLHADNPLVYWKDASISAIELRADKTIRYYRNGKRPLYHSKLKNGFIVTSTSDIMKRVDSSIDSVRLFPGIYNIIKDNVLHENNIQHIEEIESELNIQDLQP